MAYLYNVPLFFLVTLNSVQHFKTVAQPLLGEKYVTEKKEKKEK